MNEEAADTPQPKPIFKVITILWFLVVWIAISYFIWKPLILPFLVLLSGYGATYLRKNLIYGGYLRAVISGVIWGLFLSFSLYYLVKLTNSSFWWSLTNYFLGFFAVNYIGHRGIMESYVLKDTKWESVHLVAQFSSIISYVLALSLLSIA